MTMIRTATDIALPLSVPAAIRLHGLLTTHIEHARQKLDLLRTLRAGITDQEDISEVMVADSIRDWETILHDLEPLLYRPRGETHHD